MKAAGAALMAGLIAAPLAAAPAMAAPGGGSGGHLAVAQVNQPRPSTPAPQPTQAGHAGQSAQQPSHPGDKAGPGAPNVVRPLAIPTDPVLAHLSPVYEGCMHKAGSTTDMIDCAGRENDRWDARLGRAYTARMTSFNDRQRTALKLAQKAWIAFRQADCTAYQDEDWGTASRIDASQCVLRRTVERTLELEAFPADHGPG